MSLLMDALRKAEQEKKEAAKRLREQNKPSDNTGDEHSGELTLVLDDRHDAADSSEDPESSETSVAADVPAASETGTESGGSAGGVPVLSLSPLDDDNSKAAAAATPSTPAQHDVPAQQPAAATSGDDTLEGRTIDPGSDDDTLVSDEWAAARPEDPSSRTDENQKPAPTPAPLTARQPDQDTLRDTVQDARLTATVAGTLDRGESDNGRKFSPATAQSVFAARKKSGNHTMRTAVAVIVLSVIAAIAYSVVAYYAVTPTVRELPSPTVARGVEQVDPPPVLPVEPLREPAVIDPIALIEPVPAVPAEPDIAAVTDAAESDAVTAPVDEVADDATVVTEPEAAPVADAPESPPDAAVMQPADAHNVIELKPALLQISRSQPVEDRSARAVNDAYQAYRQGRYDTANALYGAVLAENPDHRDALLGMAAIALRTGQTDRGYNYYTRVLRLNPSDRVAQTALIGLQTQTDPVASESRIRLLLEETPDAPYLHFTLGNLFASQSRWPDAQQAYFDAFRLDSSNADYAVNLAVSLDRLGQPRAARDYYRRALELADAGNVNFDTAQISLRLQALSAVLDSQ